MVQKFRLPADFVVRQFVGSVRLGDQILRLLRPSGCGRNEGMRRAAVLVEAARTKALRVRVIGHDIRRDVPGQIRAALETGLGVAEIRRVEVETGGYRTGDVAPTGNDPGPEAVKTAKDAAFRSGVEAVMDSPRRERQDLRNQVEVRRGEESGLLGGAHRVLIERRGGGLNTGIHDGRAGERADVPET